MTIPNIPSLCAVPYTKAYVTNNGTYRDCCVTTPQVRSHPTESFKEWWNSSPLNDVRKSLQDQVLPNACQRCAIQETIQNTSLRLSVNKAVGKIAQPYEFPTSWDIMFGNKCNLACWSCSEESSSLIAVHKKKINILPDNFVDPTDKFLAKWPELRANILTSYQHHKIVTITILGGEPVYNNTVVDFLKYLIKHNLSSRTRLEFITNGTLLGSKLLKILDANQWNYNCVFISVDAVGPKANWLRYGSKWDEIKQNILTYTQLVNYVEIHTTVSILNLHDLPAIKEFCDTINLPHKVSLLSTPGFMDIRQWDMPITYPIPEAYQTLVGSKLTLGSSNRLKAYISQFADIREPLSKFDATLANALGVD